MHRKTFSAPLLAAALVLGAAHGQIRVATLGGGGAAEPPSEPATDEPVRSEPARPSDADLKTFAEIYAQLQQADERFEQDMASARTEEQARAVTSARERASVAALSSHGWTRRKFDEVAAAINADPALVERAIELFEQDS